MRPIFPRCILACVAAVTLAHGTTCPELTADESSAQAQAAFAAWNDAVRQKNLERTMDVFSQAIRFQVQGSPDFGYPRLLENYTEHYGRENATLWQGFIENLVASPQMVTLFTEWKQTPAGGGDAISQFRGAAVFQRESDCAWRIIASLNYVDAATIFGSPKGHSPSPATVRTDKAQRRIAGREPAVRDPDFVSGQH